MGRPKGSRQSPEARAKVSRALKGRTKTPEHKAKLSASMKGRKHPAGTWRLTEAQRQAIRIRVQSPEFRKMVGDFHRGRKRPPETGRRMSEAQKGLPKTPEHAEKCRNNGRKHQQHTEAAKAKIREASIRYWATHKPSGGAVSSLEKFVLDCLSRGTLPYEPQGFIPGFDAVSGHAKHWDIILPTKNIAIEIDGRHWHSSRNPNWNPVKEQLYDLIANELGWQVKRIPETVIIASKVFQSWYRANYKKCYPNTRRYLRPPTFAELECYPSK